MGFRYERTFAPSEELSNYAAKALGKDIVELPIWIDYLIQSGAPLRPPPSPLTHYRDNGIQAKYIEVMGDRHGPDTEARMRTLARTKNGVRVPDISTYCGRYLPPRILAPGPPPIEDTSRSEYYEIKPDSDSGEAAGVEKLAAIAAAMPKYGLRGTYQPGASYPRTSPVHIPLTWSEAFEYLRLVFMWQHSLKECDLDLQVQRHAHQPGLLLYAFRVRLGLDEELARERLQNLAAGVAVALAACATAGILELTIGWEALGIAAGTATEVAEALGAAGPGSSAPGAAPPGAPAQAGPPAAPETFPRIDLPPEHPGGPRVRVELPPEIPEVGWEADGDLEEEVVLKQVRALGEALLARGYGISGRQYDVYCDETFFQNVVIDRSTADRFAASMRVGLPRSPAIVLAAASGAAYASLYATPFTAASRLVDEIGARYPAVPGFSRGDSIPTALHRICGETPARPVSTVTNVLTVNAALAAYIDPARAANARRPVGSARPTDEPPPGDIALPPAVLSRWKGRDAGAGAIPRSLADLVAILLGRRATDERAVHYLTDALADREALRRVLAARPGFVAGIGLHGLYAAPAGDVTPANRHGILTGVTLSRLFVTTVRAGAGRPGGMYTAVDPSRSSQGPVPGGTTFRYLGRMRATR